MSVLAAIMEHYRLFLVNVDADVRRAERLESNEAISRFRTEDDRISNLLPRLRDGSGRFRCRASTSPLKSKSP